MEGEQRDWLHALDYIVRTRLPVTTMVTPESVRLVPTPAYPGTTVSTMGHVGLAIRLRNSVSGLEAVQTFIERR
jgi:hypothetical protein